MPIRLREDVRTALPKLKAGGYKTLYVDPPWDWMQGGHAQRDWQSKETGRSNHSMVGATPYVQMKMPELLALADSVKRVTAANSHLYLWTINKTIPDAVRLVKAWGYQWISVVTWGKGRPGIAKYFQGVTEHWVFAARGRLPYKFAAGKMQQGHTLVAERMTDHSRRPQAVRDMIEKVSYSPYLGLFGRRVPKH